eukprot:6183015-Pleurochrysis_carterae.AAC.2
MQGRMHYRRKPPVLLSLSLRGAVPAMLQTLIQAELRRAKPVAPARARGPDAHASAQIPPAVQVRCAWPAELHREGERHVWRHLPRESAACSSSASPVALLVTAAGDTAACAAGLIVLPYVDDVAGTLKAICALKGRIGRPCDVASR